LLSEETVFQLIAFLVDSLCSSNMKLIRRTSSAADDPSSCAASKPAAAMTNKLFQPNVKILVHRAPLLSGLHVPLLSKKFQRPMLKRRRKDADDHLLQSSLGPKRRLDGMAKLLARAGKGLHYKLPTATKKEDGSTESESEDDDDDPKGPEAPYEPLCLWTSPHDGNAEAKGLKPQMYVQCSAIKRESMHVTCDAMRETDGASFESGEARSALVDALC
jgi:hypothetical protein